MARRVLGGLHKGAHGGRRGSAANLDGKAPGVFVTGGQQDVVASQVSMQHIKLMQISQGGSNLLGCQQNIDQVWLSHWGGLDGGRSEPALLNTVLQSQWQRCLTPVQFQDGEVLEELRGGGVGGGGVK